MGTNHNLNYISGLCLVQGVSTAAELCQQTVFRDQMYHPVDVLLTSSSIPEQAQVGRVVGENRDEALVQSRGDTQGADRDLRNGQKNVYHPLIYL